MRIIVRSLVLVLFVCVWVPRAQGGSAEARRWDYTADFEDGVLLDWDYDEDAVSITGGGGGADPGMMGGLEPVGGDGGDASLHIPRAGEAVLRDQEFDALSAIVEVQGNGGLRVGGRYSFLLVSDAEGNLKLRVESGETTEEVPARGRPKAESRAKGQGLKVVCAGSLVRAYVNGQPAFETLDARPKKAPIALVAGEEGALFDNLRISTDILPEEGTAAVPDAAGEALVFTADQSVDLPLRLTNRSETNVRLVGRVGPFRGVPLGEEGPNAGEARGGRVVPYGVHKYYRVEMLDENPFGTGEMPVRTGAAEKSELGLGKLPVGLHMLELSFKSEGKNFGGRMYPVAVVEPHAQQGYRRPTIPVAVYSRYMHYRRKMDPVWWKTYVHAIAAGLRRHNFNAIVACGGFDEGVIEIYNRYGIAGISRGGRYLDHSGVIASFVSDEPHPGEELEELKQTYAALRGKTDKVVTTCIIGEGMGLGGPGDPVNLWKELQPQVRVFRWYGVKKHHYGIMHPLHYKGILPFASVLRIAESSAKTPWWIILPAFGGDQHEAYFQNPSPAQLRGMMHLTAAYGGDGIVLFQYQIGMVDPVTLEARDGKLAAAGEVAGKITAPGNFFATMKRAGLDVRCASPMVDALPVQSGAEKRLCVYVVNKNTEEEISTELMLWDEVWDWTRCEDLFSGEEMKVERNEEGFLTIPVVLRPGEGKLLATDAVHRQ